MLGSNDASRHGDAVCHLLLKVLLLISECSAPALSVWLLVRLLCDSQTRQWSTCHPQAVTRLADSSNDSNVAPSDVATCTELALDCGIAMQPAEKAIQVDGKGLLQGSG